MSGSKPTPMDVPVENNGGQAPESKPDQGGKVKNPPKQVEKASSTEMASRLLAAYGVSGRFCQSPPSSLEDMLPPEEVDGKESQKSLSNLRSTVNSDAKSVEDDGDNRSVVSDTSSSLDPDGLSGAGQGQSSGKHHAAKGQGKKKTWKGKALDSMTEDELKQALEERKESLERKRQDRDETQAEWVRLVKPVVNDDNPGLYKRVLKAMGISEERIRSQGNYLAKLMDEGKKTLALILWVQQRDTTNLLIRYITGQMVHEPATATQGATLYDPEVAIEEKSMQVKLMQLLVELAKRQTKREAAMAHAALAERQADQQSKNKRRWNKGGKGKEVDAKKPKPSAPSTSTSSSAGVGPSGLFKDPASDTGKRRYPSNEGSAEKPPKKQVKVPDESITEALQNVTLDGKNVVKKVKIPTSKVNTIETKLNDAPIPAKKEQKQPDSRELKPENCDKLIHPSCLNCSEEEEVKVTYAKAADEATKELNPFQNPDSIKVIRQTLDDEGNLTTDYPGMSKSHWDGRFLPAMEQIRKEENIRRLQLKERPIRAIRAQRYATGKPNKTGQDQPNYGLLLPFDGFNSQWLIEAINGAELSAGTDEKVYRYQASLAFKSGSETCILSFKVNKIGSDVSENAWEMFCFDNNIDSSWAMRLEPKCYPNETEGLFVATRRLVEQLKAGDDKVGRLPSKVLFGFQGQRELLHKTKPLSGQPLNKIQFQYGHL